MIPDRFFVEDVETELLAILDCIVVGNANDPRSAALPERWAHRFQGRSLCLAYDVRQQRVALEQILLSDEAGRLASSTTADITQLYAEVDAARFDGLSLLVDFTGIEQPALFFLLKAFRETRRLRRIFGAYTEPLGYKTREGAPFQESFDLSARQ